MSLSIAVCPSTPLLVPELGGGAAGETAGLRAAALDAVRALPARWIAIGAAAVAGRYGSGAAGTFAGFGVDVPVGLSAVALSAGAKDSSTDLPLPVLIAGWLRGQMAANTEVEARVLAPAQNGYDAGRALRAEIDAAAVPVGVVVIADGANTLTDKAPGGYRPEASGAQQALRAALADGDPVALEDLPDLVTGRCAYAALAGLVGADSVEAQRLYASEPYGVGYVVATWRLP